MNCHIRKAVARNLVIVVASTVTLLGASAGEALAGNAHFIKSQTSASLSGSSLVVQFKEAGLPSGASETITTSASASTTYECVNGGGKNPSAANKTTTQSNVSTSGTFSADKNGNVTGSESLSPPTASALGFSCPAGQKVTFVSVTYSDVVINDTTSGASISFGDTFSFTNGSAP